MKTKHLLSALAAAFVLTACSYADGDWDTMEWEKISYASTKLDDKQYFKVPQQGGTYTFTCKNYEGFKLYAVDIVTSGYGFTIEKHLENNTFGNDWNEHHMSSDGCTVDIDGNIMTVNFVYSDARRTYEVRITTGDIFDTFRFIQQ